MAVDSDKLLASLPMEPGDVVADTYRVDRLLGTGGMGVVVAATHVQLDEARALKFMRPEVVDDSAAVTRFFREARAAARLKSKHVAQIFDLGRLDDGTPFLVLEYLEGDDLGTVLEERGRLPVRDAVDYTMQALAGLAEAHAQGIVHRDLKPENLFLTTGTDGLPLVKIVDFGVSKLLGPAQGSVAALTQATSTVGCPFYMSPEQLASARLVDSRTDLWSVGVMLYEMLTGQLPFDAESLTAVAIEVVQRIPPKPSELQADVAEGLDDVVMKCLAKQPEERYQHAAEVACDLAPFGGARAEELAEHVRRVHSAPRSSRPTRLREQGQGCGDEPDSLSPAEADCRSGAEIGERTGDNDGPKTGREAPREQTGDDNGKSPVAPDAAKAGGLSPSAPSDGRAAPTPLAAPASRGADEAADEERAIASSRSDAQPMDPAREETTLPPRPPTRSLLVIVACAIALAATAAWLARASSPERATSPESSEEARSDRAPPATDDDLREGSKREREGSGGAASGEPEAAASSAPDAGSPLESTPDAGGADRTRVSPPRPPPGRLPDIYDDAPVRGPKTPQQHRR